MKINKIAFLMMLGQMLCWFVLMNFIIFIINITDIKTFLIGAGVISVLVVAFCFYKANECIL